MAHDGATRPLVVRFGAMGDMVIVLVLIEALHRRFGVPVDVISSGGWTQPLLHGQPGVGNLYLIRSRRTPYVISPMQWRLVEALRARGVGPVWLCDRGMQARALLARAGIAPAWIVDAENECRRLPGEHNVDRWMRFARMSPAALPQRDFGDAASIVIDITSPPLRVLPAWREDLAAWLRAHGLSDRPLVLIQAGNKRTMRRWARRQRATNTKYWPEDRWSAVIASLLRRDPRIAVLLLGVPVEYELNENIGRQVRSDRVLNVARELPIARLLALQERALGMISVDTGPAHSAAALDCPLVTLIEAAKAERYAPRSAHGAVQVLTGRPDAGDGLLGISVQDVEEAWDRLLGGSRHLRSAS